MQTARAKITKRVVDGAVPPTKGEARVRDTDVKGFMLLIYPTGRKVYAIKCRVCRVQSIRAIGEHGSPWTPGEAS